MRCARHDKLQKILARSGYGARRKIEALIEQGRVSVDGQVATLGDRVEVINTTKIRIDGRIITIQPVENNRCRVLAYYKQEGELCTRRDPDGRPTVFDRLPLLNHSRWVAIGRLDINTSGLLLFTNDGELAHFLMHPSCEIEREYAVRVFGIVDEGKLRQLTSGVQLEDGYAYFNSLKLQEGGTGLNQWYTVTLKEGRNREVRRMWEAVGLQVSRLIRVRYGNISLPKGMQRGSWAMLPPEQISYLMRRDYTGNTIKAHSRCSGNHHSKKKQLHSR
ncbi:Ribosomal large subunit pseudouridine synthase B [Candidatus Moranella endobia PCVAL]|uniref:23S rRNA pseudouridine(2605) synthase RluB n=1 Tax=Candidatus Moranella endobia TaxID=1048758 RepID=UPI0002C6CBEA|nr:Ribosomal large subunit pseudouridine synthase B [Candidatus Moranella endobia PCVAL]